ncbi:MAG: hypothetical protein OXF61_10735 [Acidimicrobiaceae bacterium]|nr:hypothetical protein [Acidimicrobiaceae bacterium]
MRQDAEDFDSDSRRHQPGLALRIATAFVSVFLLTATVAWPAGAEEGLLGDPPSGPISLPKGTGEGSSADLPSDPPFEETPTDDEISEDTPDDSGTSPNDAGGQLPEDALSELLSRHGDLSAEVSGNRAALPVNSDAVESSDDITVQGQFAKLSIPRRSDDAITVSLATGTTIGLVMPGLDRDLRISDDSVIFDEIMQSTSAIVHPQQDGGFRVLLAIDGPDSPTDFAFPIQGVGLRQTLQPDGGVLVVDNEQNGIRFETPWAYDANGVPVPASYSLIDGALVLKIEPSADTAYPIVADPWGTIFGWFTKSLKFAAKFVTKLATPVQVAWDIANRRISKTWPKYLAGWSAGTLTFLVCGAGAAATGIAVFGLGSVPTSAAAVSACATLGFFVGEAVAQVVDTS